MNKIKAHWELNQTEIDSIETSNEEILQDQILYSLARQLRELTLIHEKTGKLIETLTHAQTWFRGLE